MNAIKKLLVDIEWHSHNIENAIDSENYNEAIRRCHELREACRSYEKEVELEDIKQGKLPV